MKVRIEKSWKDHLKEEFEKPYFKELTDFVRQEYTNHVVFPPPAKIFAAFEKTPFDSVKVVILGQDPYHGVGQANGLCFSVTNGIKPPPSLQNIYKEIASDLNTVIPESGDLTRWAKQGVLLLNATLTVVAQSPGSHQKKGWEHFTDSAIQALNNEKEGLVFMLWGRYAKEKGAFIDRNKHLVLEAAHPSPFSAYSGFFGCRHFSQANEYLNGQGKEGIDW